MTSLSKGPAPGVAATLEPSWTKECGPPILETAKTLHARANMCGLLILTAGFEERARALADRMLTTETSMPVVLIRYDGGIKENEDAYSHLMQRLSSLVRSDRLVEVRLDPRKPESFDGAFRAALGSLSIDASLEVWLDISGLPMWGICAALRCLRSGPTFWRMRVFYTAAKTYFPTHEEYKASAAFRESGNLAPRLPDSLTSEMAGNLILEGFAGVSLREHSTCLILFAGYEKHRSLGVIEEINPSLLVIVYGRPGLLSLHWRLAMSRKLHATLCTERPTAEEEVSTLSLSGTTAILQQYYSMLYDDHNICIAPVCSKMQAVGCYLIWERYRDVQLTFPLPVTYLPNRFSEGIGRTFSIGMPPPPGLAEWLRGESEEAANS